MILLYATDLIFTTRIRAEATAAGASVQVARGVESLRSKLQALSGAGGVTGSPPPSVGDSRTLPGTAALVIVDLDADAALDAVRAAAECPTRPRVVAFVSHVRADLASSARDAGAGAVLARSEFVRRLPELAREAAP